MRTRFCVFFFPGGCPDREERGYCDHAFYTTLCDHVRQANDPMYETPWCEPFLDEWRDGCGDAPDDLCGLTAEWVARLTAADEKAYATPERKPAGDVADEAGALPYYEYPIITPERLARVAIYAARHAAGLDLHHQGDTPLDAMLRLGRAVRRGNNGKIIELDIDACYDQDDDAVVYDETRLKPDGEYAYQHSWYGDFEEWHLQRYHHGWRTTLKDGTVSRDFRAWHRRLRHRNPPPKPPVETPDAADHTGPESGRTQTPGDAGGADPGRD